MLPTTPSWLTARHRTPLSRRLLAARQADNADVGSKAIFSPGTQKPYNLDR
jgi:hypothetical protein